MSGGTVVAGAGDDHLDFAEDSSATGVNGNQNDNSAPDSGAAYVFVGLGPAPRLALISDNSSGYFIRFKGIPGSTYRLQRATDLAGPWTTSAPQTTPTSGLVEFWDLFPPRERAFYRAIQP